MVACVPKPTAKVENPTSAQRPCAFPRQRRLLRPAEFQRVFRQKTLRSADDVLTLFAAPNSLSYSRLGLAIAKKQLRHAHQRNLIKRLVRESFRQQNLPPIDIVVMVRSPIAKLPNLTVTQCLDRHWQRLIKRNKSADHAQ